MVVLGVVLLAGAAVLAVSMVMNNTGAVEIDLWGMSSSHLSLGAVFALGLITAAVGLAGLFLVTTGVRRSARLRRERRTLTRENRQLTREVQKSAGTPAASEGPTSERSGKHAADRARPERERVGQSEPTG